MHVARTEAWNGLSAGDPVRISGLRGRRWRFRCHVENLATGEAWVEVAELDLPRGGRVPGDRGRPDAPEPPVRRIRSFAEARVVPLRRRRRGRLDPPPGQGTFEIGLPSPLAPAEPTDRRSPTRARSEPSRTPAAEAQRLFACATGEEAKGPAGDEQAREPS